MTVILSTGTARPDGKLYLLIGGEVSSQHDGEWHYVNATRLAQLYRLPYKQCILYDPGFSPPLHGVHLTGLVVLRPRWDGDYTLPPGGSHDQGTENAYGDG